MHNSSVSRERRTKHLSDYAAGHVYDFPSTPAAPYEVPSKAGARSAPIVAITS